MKIKDVIKRIFIAVKNLVSKASINTKNNTSKLKHTSDNITPDENKFLETHLYELEKVLTKEKIDSLKLFRPIILPEDLLMKEHLETEPDKKNVDEDFIDDAYITEEYLTSKQDEEEGWKDGYDAGFNIGYALTHKGATIEEDYQERTINTYNTEEDLLNSAEDAYHIAYKEGYDIGFAEGKEADLEPFSNEEDFEEYHNNDDWY